MHESVERFFSQLHGDYLKPLGYKKHRHTFVRELDGFTERVQFQGSSWNDNESPWRFYVNFGIQFHGLPPQAPDRDLPATHCWTRIDSIIVDAPKESNLTGVDDDLARNIALLLDQASKRIWCGFRAARTLRRGAYTPVVVDMRSSCWGHCPTRRCSGCGPRLRSEPHR